MAKKKEADFFELIQQEANFTNELTIKVKELLSIIDSYENSECVMNSDERKIIVYRGDPYITLHLCLQALTLRNKFYLMGQ